MADYVLRYQHGAQDPAKYREMIDWFRRATEREELKEMSLIFILDLSYERADICLALKTVEMERGWHV